MKRVIILSAIFFTTLVTMGQSKDSLMIQAKTKHLVDSTKLIPNSDNSSFKERKELNARSGSLKSINRHSNSSASKSYGYHNSSAVFRRRNHNL